MLLHHPTMMMMRKARDRMSCTVGPAIYIFQQLIRKPPPLYPLRCRTVTGTNRRRSNIAVIPSPLPLLQLQRYPSKNHLLHNHYCHHHSNSTSLLRTTYKTSLSLSSSSSSSFRTIVSTSTIPPRTDTTRNHAITTNEYNKDNHNNHNNNHNNIRISKFIATCMGISRKDVERHIQDGNVTLYGKVVTSSAMMISYPEISRRNNVAALTLQKKTVPVLQYYTSSSSSTNISSNHNDNNNNTKSTQSKLPSTPIKKVRVWLVHKMAGELVTDIDPYQRPTVMSRIHSLGTYNRITQRREHIKIVGRLDMSTEGLLIVTNCGIYARQLEWSKHMLHRVYRVRVHGRPLVPYQINMIQSGQVVVDQIQYPPMKVSYDTKSRKNTTATNQWMTITCTQGKNRQIRKVLQHFHCTVTRLIRISYGDYQLGTIPKGLVQEVTNDPNDHTIGGIIPYSEHVRRGKLFEPRTVPKGHPPSSSSTLRSSDDPHRNSTRISHKSKRTAMPSSKTTTTTATAKTGNRRTTTPIRTTGRTRRTSTTTTTHNNKTSPIPPPHRPVQWIRM